MRDGLSRGEFTDARRAVHGLLTPGVSEAAIDGLKFSELLTDADAADVISARMTDEVGANAVLASPTVFL